MPAPRVPSSLSARIGAGLLAATTLADSGACGAARGQGAAPGDSDLAVQIAVHRERRQDRWLLRVRFDVRNLGPGPAPASTLGCWCAAESGGPCPPFQDVYDVAPPVQERGTVVVRLATPAIPPGGGVFVFGPSTGAWPSGVYTLSAHADILQAVQERAETNNRATALARIP